MSTKQAPAAAAAAASDPIGRAIGDIGRWQLERIAVVFWIGVPGIAHIFSSIFATFKTSFWCAVDYPSHNATNPPQIPFNVSQACKPGCQEYTFDQTFWKSSIIQEWDLICEWSHLPVIAKMVLFAGFGCGTFGAGMLSDYYGRRSAILFMSQLLFGCGILATTMPSYPAFTAIWFLTGVAAIGTYTVCFVWALESVSGKWKTIMGMTVNFAWPVGRFLVTGIAWLTRDWKTILQILSGVHIVTPLLMNFVPESPRWLLAKSGPGQKEEAVAILEAARARNGRTEKIDWAAMTATSSSGRKEGFIGIFKHSVLLKRALIMYFNWFVNSFILYGLSLNWQSLTGNLFMNFVIGSALDFPAKGLALLLIWRAGRRLPYICCMAVCGIAFLVMLAFEKGTYPGDWPMITAALIGNFAISTSFAILWVYTAELFPTNVRNAGLGSCSLVSRIGGVVSTTVGKMGESVHPALPIGLFGVSALISAIISIWLPETTGKPLPDSVEDCEEDTLLSTWITKKKTSYNLNSNLKNVKP